MVLRSGELIGKYRVLRLLGRGGMGIIYLAEDTHLRRNVALKVLCGSLSYGDALAERFEQEARSIAALSHPNIVRIHALEYLDGHYVIDMEYIDSGSLADLMEKGNLSLGRLLEIARDVLRALAWCHERHIVHRDVKPSNILMDSSGRALLADFGLAKILSDAFFKHAVLGDISGECFVGTPRYAPPEAWDGDAPDPGWDLYSLGLVLYEAISGGLPFNSQDQMSFYRQKTTYVLPPLHQVAPNVSKSLSRLVADLIKPSSQDRLLDAATVLKRLEAVPEAAAASWNPINETVLERWERRPASLRLRPSRRRRVLRLVLPALALVLSAALFLVFPEVKDRLWRAVSFSRTPQEGLSLDSSVVQAALRSGEELLRLPRRSDEGPYLFFEVSSLDSESGGRSQWMMQSPEKAAKPWVLARTGRGLWYLHAETRSDGRLSFTGNWAEYAGPSATRIRYGAVTGLGEWVDELDSLVASLTFQNMTDNTLVRENLLARRVKTDYTDSRFIHDLEQADYAMPLLFNELLPRRLDWARTIDALLPTVPGERVDVPRIAEDIGSIVVDASLTERLWSTDYRNGQGQAGQIRGACRQDKCLMLLRQGDSCLALGIRALCALPPEAGLRLVLLGASGAPTRAAPRLEVAFEPNGHVRVFRAVGGRKIPWEGAEPTLACADHGTEWVAECVIPFDALPGTAPIAAETTWRLNCALLDLASPEAPATLTWWGFPEVEQVEHGMLVRFAPAESAG